MNDAKKYVTYKIASQFCKYKVIYLPRNGDPSTSPAAPLRMTERRELRFLHSLGNRKKDAECSNRTRRGDPKLYIGTARGEVWTEKKEYLFRKSL